MTLVDLKARASLLDVLESLGARMSLGHSWDDETYVWCPFCEDGASKKPAGRANELKGLYFCFSCGTGGDVIKLVQIAKDFTFLDAVEWLEERYPVAPEADPWTT